MILTLFFFSSWYKHKKFRLTRQSFEKKNILHRELPTFSFRSYMKMSVVYMYIKKNVRSVQWWRWVMLFTHVDCLHLLHHFFLFPFNVVLYLTYNRCTHTCTKIAPMFYYHKNIVRLVVVVYFYLKFHIGHTLKNQVYRCLNCCRLIFLFIADRKIILHQ